MVANGCLHSEPEGTVGTGCSPRLLCPRLCSHRAKEQREGGMSSIILFTSQELETTGSGGIPCPGCPRVGTTCCVGTTALSPPLIPSGEEENGQKLLVHFFCLQEWPEHRCSELG